MPNGQDINSDELFELILSRLDELKAYDLKREIESTISRGVVINDRSNESREFRRMNSDERLSVAMEHILSAFSAPVMLAQSLEILRCNEISWKSEDERAESFDPIAPSNKDQIEVLSKLAQVFDEINLSVPEVA